MRSSIEKNNRQSNLELARIVSMAAIVVWHFIFHGVYQSNLPEYVSLTSAESHEDIFLLAISLFICFGTNLFVLISGYFGIKLTWKGIVNLWLLTTTYNLLSVAISGSISISSILHSLVISSTEHWFFQAYLWLMLASPLLNSGIDSLDQRKLTFLVIVGGILCCVSGWFFENNNSTGHNALQLFYVYIIGRYIYKIALPNKITSVKAAIIYMGSCLCAIVFMMLYQRRGTFMHTHHNNPFILISSIAVFLLFTKMSIKSKSINFIAKSVPAVLLISDMVFDESIYSIVFDYFQQFGIGLKFGVVMIVMLIAVFIVSILIDLIRRLLAWKLCPILSDKLNKYIPIN